MKNYRAFVAAIIILSSSGCSLVIPSHHDPLAYKAIDAATEGGDMAAVQALYRRDHGVVGAKDWDNLTPLHLAVLHKHYDVAVFLIDHGADVNAKSSKGITPLHFAAQGGDIRMVNLLIAHKADVKAVDSQGWTPRDRAIKWGHLDVARLLRRRGG
jgi:ankyrin repeat protein